MKRYFSTSATLHISCCLLLLFTTANPISTIPPQEIEMELSQNGNESNIESEQQVIEKEQSGSTCDFWYGGIGIQGNRIIEIVYPNYPADKAGVRPKDFILSNEEIRGEPGSVLELDILRNNVKLHFSIVREKICIQ